jgi:putative peptidoglycan lipid II flippase
LTRDEAAMNTPAQPATPVPRGAADESLASVAHGSRLVAAWVLVSRVSGFGRVAVAGAVLGPTFFGNLFQLTNSIPALVFGLLFGSLVSAMLVPPLVERLDRAEPDGARRLADGVLGIFLVLFAGVAVLGIFLADPILWLITAGVADPDVRREQMRLGLPLIVVLLPQLPCYALSAVAAAAQQARGRFALAAAAPAVDNIAAIAVLVAFGLLSGAGQDLHAIEETEVLLLGLGTTGAVALCATLQWWGAARAGLRLVPRAGWRQPEIRAMFRMGASSLGSSGLASGAYFGLSVVAGFVPGGVAAFQIANSFVQLPIALTAGALAVVQLPHLSRTVHEGRMADFAAIHRSAMALVVFTMLPASLLLVVMPQALAQAVAFGRMGAPEGIALLAACIAARGIGALAEAIVMLGTSASYARRDSVSPLRAKAIMAAVCVLGMAAAPALHDPVVLMWVLGGAWSVAHILAALDLTRRQLRVLPDGARLGLRPAAVTLLLSALSALLAWLVLQHAEPWAVLPFGHIQLAAAAGAAALVTYLILQFARGSTELALLLPRLGHLRRNLWGVRARASRRPHAAVPGEAP